MDDIIDMAAKLGKAIAESPQATTLAQARKQMDAQPEILQLLQAFRDQSARIAELQKTNQPIEVTDKHKLDDLHGKLVSQEAFKQFTAAQVEFVDLMRKVNAAISDRLQQEPE